MGEFLRTLLLKLKVKGFTGPRYKGIAGKLRFAWESLVYRREILLAIEARAFDGRLQVPSDAFQVDFIDQPGLTELLLEEVDSAYYPGFSKGWNRYLQSGDRLALARLESAFCGFLWIQSGSDSGLQTYYGMLMRGEARIFRAGVSPAHRQRNVYKKLLREVLQRLFESGDIVRVYVDCHWNNIPALSAHRAVGFREIATVNVLGTLIPGRYVSIRKHAPETGK